jgi:uncharacterized protein YndB with AHSA1/START domain
MCNEPVALRRLTVSEVETEQEQSVEREATLDTSPERAWEAISDPAELERWLAEEVELEPVEGAPARFVVDGDEKHGEVREVEDGRRISFTWRAPEEPATLVELTLEPLADDGPVRLTVVETAPAGVPLAATPAAAWSPRLQAAGASTGARVPALV